MAIDWTKLFEQHKGKWVALADDEKTVLSSGFSAAEVWEQARKKAPKPILMQVPEEVIAYAG